MMYAEAVVYEDHGTKELQLRVRTGVIARGARLNAGIVDRFVHAILFCCSNITHVRDMVFMYCSCKQKDG